MDDLLPALKIDTQQNCLDQPAGLFEPAVRDVWLEIGFGGGEHLAWQAAAHPQIGIVGCEPFTNGVAKLLNAIEDRELTNVRIWDDDARLILPSIGEQTIGRVFVLYPDPWPKRRHHKRRLINQHMLDYLYHVMRPGAELRFASDIADYVRWTLAAVRRHGGFHWMAETSTHWRNRPDDWPQTRYEAKAIRQGRKPVYLTFERQ